MLLQPYFIAQTPMYKLKRFVNETHEVNKGIAVFERYQKAAVYDFYTQDTAISVQVYTHRKSQYDLWDENQSLLQGKKITYFTLDQVSSYFILDEEKKNEHYITIPRFYSYPKISCTVEPAVFDSTENLDVVWSNPYDKKLTLAKGTQLEAGIWLIGAKASYGIFIPFFESVEIPAHSTVKSRHSVDIRALGSDTYKGYVVLSFFGVSKKIISNEVDAHVE